MDYLGLDLGTRCGWARVVRSKAGEVFQTGVFDLSITRFDTASLRGVKLKRCVAPLLEGGVKHVFYEKVMAHKGVAAAHVYGGLMSALQEICEQYDTPCEGIAVGTIKRHATGKGNASKAAMCDAFAKAVGRLAADDNEADAYWVLRCGMARMTHEALQ